MAGPGRIAVAALVVVFVEIAVELLQDRQPLRVVDPRDEVEEGSPQARVSGVRPMQGIDESQRCGGTPDLGESPRSGFDQAWFTGSPCDRGEGANRSGISDAGQGLEDGSALGAEDGGMAILIHQLIELGSTRSAREGCHQGVQDDGIAGGHEGGWKDRETFGMRERVEGGRNLAAKTGVRLPESPGQYLVHGLG